MYNYVYSKIMKISWNHTKQRKNLHKHGLDFSDAELVFAGATVTFDDDRYEYGENRFITLGMLYGAVVVIAHTEEDEVIRILSMRKATKNEQKIYYQNFLKD